MTLEQLDEIEKLARDPKSAVFHDLMTRQTLPLVKALREASAKHNEALDMCQRYMGRLHKALEERDAAQAEVERLREAVGVAAAGVCFARSACACATCSARNALKAEAS